jgi:hypothetical protein
MASSRGDALNKTQTPENEPDVKRGPGGLRDRQCALSVKTLASGRPAVLAEPELIEAHRFLWLARCHLHLLVGRAEDRLGSALQPDVARRSLGDGARALDASDREIRLNQADDWTVWLQCRGNVLRYGCWTDTLRRVSRPVARSAS